ncbi:hypothetical protein ASPZODRAFT_30080, partial [Penicilliopsis zonata CBS 506.65]
LPMTPPDPMDAGVYHGSEPGSSSRSGSGSGSGAAVLTAVHVIATERAALENLETLYQSDRMAQENLARAVDQIVRSMQRGGKLVVCGVGKSGKIGKKVEATMNSMGIHSAFLHPTEALHGDLGLIRPVDTLLLISFSGRTPELMLLLPHIPPTVPVIAITSHTTPTTCPLLSFLPPDLGILLPAPIHEDEESSFGVCAPTSSTTVALCLGDAVALAVARALHDQPGRGPAEVFKGYHPGGAIGAALAAAISTPSMSTSASTASLTSIPSDYLHSKPVTYPYQPYVGTGRMQELITDLFVPSDQIPTVSSSLSSAALLDILLTAIQHPTAKSWVFLSPTTIVPPTHTRSLCQNRNVDLPLSEIPDDGRFAVHATDWIRVPASRTREQTQRYLAGVAGVTPTSVVAVMDTLDPKLCLGFIEAKDL